MSFKTPDFIDYDLAVTNRVAAAWLNGANLASYPAGGLTNAQITSMVSNRGLGYINVKWCGALGNGSTDDYASFLRAYTLCVTLGLPMYIPGVNAPTAWYKLSQTLIILQDRFALFGDGRSSMVVAFNATALDAISVEADFVSIHDLAITGIAGSGNGLKCGTTANTAYYGDYRNLWISWMGGNCLDVTHALSSVFININMDHETLTAPATLTGGTVKGARTNGVNVRLLTPANNNDLTFLGCIVNAACDSATGWEVQVGVNGSGGFTNFFWNGGLIQSYDGLIKVGPGVSHIYFNNVYIEPSVSPGTITVDGSSFVHFNGMILDANLTFTDSARCGVKNSQINGITLNGTSIGFIGENINHGGMGGSLVDNTTAGDAVFLNTISSASPVAIGWRPSAPMTRYFGTSMEEWLGGGAPSTPSGIYNFGATIAREAAIKRTGSYSMKVTCGASYATGARVDIPPEVIVNGAQIVVDAWVYVQAGDIGAVSLWLDSGAATHDQAIDKTGQWVRRVIKFAVAPNTRASGWILFSGDAGAVVYWDIIDISIEGFVLPKTKTLADSATPSLSVVAVGGPQIKNATTNAANTTITGFTEMHVGEEFTLTLGGAIDFTDSATLQLAGGVNFTAGVAGDTISFVYGTDGVMRETGRSIN